MTSFSFVDLLSDSWRLSLRRRQLWIGGAILALPILAQTYYLTDVPSQSSELISYITTHFREVSLFLIITFVCSLIGKSLLILLLHRATSKKDTSSISRRTLRQAIVRGLLIELSLLLFILLVGCVLALPLLMALMSLGTIPPILHWLSLVVILPISLVVFILREFIFFYFLLTPGIRFKSALEASVALFQRNTSLSVQFFLFFLWGALLFTFSLNLVMLGIVALSHVLLPSMADTSMLVGSFVALAFYEIVRQTVWFQFFQKLATPQDPVETTLPAILKKEITEISGV
jgi:hypothetical protein